MLIADISGYTSYLAGSEIDHAQNVLEDLLETVHARLVPPFALVKAEGDALFVFAPGGTVSGAMLLDTLDACYFGFRRRLRDVTQATTCECNACVLIPRLDLKFVAHAGEAIRQMSFGVQDLVGSDVVMVHRLLKNHVTEEHGWRAYALLTEAAVTSLGLDCPRLGMVAHQETYDDAGSVAGFIEDLDARWTADQARPGVRLSSEDAWVSMQVDLAASPPVVWEHITNPRLRREWQTWVLRIDQETVDGRPGVGTTNHCVHGQDAVLEEVVDYHPFDSMTTHSATFVGPMTMTWDFAATDTGTSLTVLCALSDTEEARLAWPMARPMIEGRFGEGFNTLQESLAAVDSAAVHS